MSFEIEVKVLTCDWRRKYFQVNKTDTIKHVKELFYNVEGYPVDEIALVFGHKFIDNQVTLEEAGISAGDCLEALLRSNYATTMEINRGCLALELMYKLVTDVNLSLDRYLTSSGIELSGVHTKTDQNAKLRVKSIENMVLYNNEDHQYWKGTKTVKLHPFMTLEEQNCPKMVFVEFEWFEDDVKQNENVNDAIDAVQRELNGVKLSNPPDIDEELKEVLSPQQKQEIMQDWQNEKGLKMAALQYKLDYLVNVKQNAKVDWIPDFRNYYRVDLEKKALVLSVLYSELSEFTEEIIEVIMECIKDTFAIDQTVQNENVRIVITARRW